MKILKNRLISPSFLVLTICMLSACGDGRQNEVTSTAASASYPGAPADSSGVASFPGVRNNYSITKTSTGFVIRDNVGTGGLTTLTNVKSLKFSDVSVNLLVGDKSKTISAERLTNLIELYVAFLNRVPDADGMSYWIDQIKAGMTPEQMSSSFYDAAIQYSRVTGYSSTMSNSDFVKVIYKNVLGREGTLAPPDADVNYWANELSSGKSTKGALIATMLRSARDYATDPQWGWVTKLLDNKIVVGNYISVQQGLTYNSGEESITKGIQIAKAVTSTDTNASKSLIGVANQQFDLRKLTTFATAVTTKDIVVLPNALVIPTISASDVPKAPTNLAAAPAEANLKIWIYDPSNTSKKLGSPGIFLAAGGGNYQFYNASTDGTVNVKIGTGDFKFDVLEANGTGATFTRRSYQGVVASAGPATPSAETPKIPANLSTAPAGSNFKLWIYDPRTPSLTLPTSIFILSPSRVWGPEIKSAADGSFGLSLATGQYEMDVAEPDPGLFKRRHYTMSVSTSGVVTIDGVTANAQGIFPLTVYLSDLPGTLVVNGQIPNANGVYAVTVDTITQPSALGQQRRDSLVASANVNVSSFKPTSACQITDQVTPVRTINGIGLTAGFPKVSWRLPSYGRIRSLIVPVDFPDVNGVDNPPAFFTPLANSVRDFYFNQSYGQVTFDFEILPTWVRMPFSVSDFGYGSTVGSGSPESYIKAMVKNADPLFDFAQYDAVYFLVPKQMPFTKMGWGPAITHPYWTKDGYLTNGASGGADMYYVEQNGIIGGQWKWMVHETGHAFGFYDEDQDHQSQTLGSWSVMANSWTNKAIEHNGWDRYVQGWLKEPQVTCLEPNNVSIIGTTIKLDPLVRQNTEMKIAMVPLSASKILVMESRKNEGFDYLPTNEEGVLVYTVDMTLAHLKGGYKTQRRVGSTNALFEDAALKTGDSLTIEGVTVKVLDLNISGDTISISKK